MVIWQSQLAGYCPDLWQLHFHGIFSNEASILSDIDRNISEKGRKI
jgi:hypothetical protein